MFDKEFYPTPLTVLESMPIDCIGKVVLEPQAGKGDIVDYLYKLGAKEVIAVERNEDLAKIVESKCKLIGSDFFDITAEQVSHVQLIVMNPPFSNANKHIEHAWSIAPEGCEVISLCNYQTIENSCRYSRVNSLVKNYGLGSNLGPTFDTAERKTGIDIGLIRLFKPVISEGADFSGFFLEDEPEDSNTTEGVVGYNEIIALVQRYVGAMKTFDRLKAVINELEYTTGVLGMSKFEIKIGYNDEVTTREAFSKALQKKSWAHIINKSGIRKFTTSIMDKDISKFVETQEKIPFTVKNVKHMLDMIFQTRGQQMEKALVAAIDTFTEHTHENRYGFEGWKTNLGHMLNKKIVINGIFERGWSDANYITVRHNSHYKEKLDDLAKVICLICGKEYKEMNGFTLNEKGERVYNRTGLYSFAPDGSTHLNTGVWYDWGFFEFKGFYKGTMHVKFKNLDDWARVNRAYGEIKGFTVPEKF